MSASRASSAASIALTLVTSCALTQKAKPLEVTYYTLERPRRGATNIQAASGPELRFGRVASGTDLGEPIVFGDGAYRVHYYDGRRWTQRPEVYVRHSLVRVLFEESGFRRAMTGDAPILDVEVLTFQEVKTPLEHAAWVTLRFAVSTDHVLLEQTLTASEPIAGDNFEEVVSAMAYALEQTTKEVARRVKPVLDSSARTP